MTSNQWRTDCLEYLAQSGATTYRVWKEVCLDTGRHYAFTSIRRALSGVHERPNLELASSIYRVCKALAQDADQTVEDA